MPHDLASTAPAKNAALRNGGRRRLLVALALFALIRAGASPAADSPANVAFSAGRNDLRPLSAGRPIVVQPFVMQPFLASPYLASPFAGQSPGSTARALMRAPEFSDPRFGKWDLSAPAWPVRGELPVTGMDMDAGKDFRPRRGSMFATEPRATNFNDPLEFDKTVWQRLQEYRTRDRVRVLTLWESTASAVSIQTDRKGGPSLQWTSRWMNRGGATRGLLDHWMPASMFRFSHSPPPHAQTTIPPAQPHIGASAIP
jgi:hypothetical protein